MTITSLAAPRLDSRAMNDSMLDPEIRRIQFEEQAIPYTAYLYAAALNKTNGNLPEAEDLVQDTFIKAFKAWHQFEQGTELKHWLSRILQNTYINKFNKKKRDKASGGLDELEDFQVANAESVTAVSELSAEAAALLRLPSKEIQAALEKLDESFRKVVEKAIIDEKSYAQIAHEEQIPIGTVMSRLHRGKAKLREYLAEYAAAEGYNIEGKSKK